MKNHHEILGIIINIIFALMILAFIVIGLNKIGIYRLPEGIEKILGTGDYSSDDDADNGASSEQELVSFDISEYSTKTGNLTYQNAKKLIEKIDYNRDYSHKLVVHNYVGNETHVENVSLECIDGMFSAILTNKDGAVIRQIKEAQDNVEITTFDNGVPVAVSLPKGNFDISDECGFVITARDFVNSTDILDEGDFSLFECEYGAAVSVTFNNTVDSLTVEEKYVISLDFGVILSVESIIDGKTVYSMSTVMLERI